MLPERKRRMSMGVLQGANEQWDLQGRSKSWEPVFSSFFPTWKQAPRIALVMFLCPLCNIQHWDTTLTLNCSWEKGSCWLADEPFVPILPFLVAAVFSSWSMRSRELPERPPGPRQDFFCSAALQLLLQQCEPCPSHQSKCPAVTEERNGLGEANRLGWPD